MLCYHVWTEAGRAKGCVLRDVRMCKRSRVNFSWSRFGVAESEVRILPRDTQIVAADISEIVGADRRPLCFEGGATACSTR